VRSVAFCVLEFPLSPVQCTPCRTKLLSLTDGRQNLTVLVDGLYVALCVELAYDGTREMLVAVLGIAFLAGSLLAGPASSGFQK